MKDDSRAQLRNNSSVFAGWVKAFRIPTLSWSHQLRFRQRRNKFDFKRWRYYPGKYLILGVCKFASTGDRSEVKPRQEIGHFQWRDGSREKLEQLKKRVNLPGTGYKGRMGAHVKSREIPAGLRNSLQRTWEKDQLQRLKSVRRCQKDVQKRRSGLNSLLVSL